MLGKHFNDTEVLDGYLFVAHLAGHTHALEHLCGIRAGTYRTGSAQTVVLTVSGLTATAESVTLHYALIALTFAGADNIDEVSFSKEVGADCVAESVSVSKSFELGQVTLGATPAFLK